MAKKAYQKAMPERRRRLLAAVHIAKKQLGMDDDTYRAVLGSFHVGSSAELNDAGLMELMRHFERCGYVSKIKPKALKGSMHHRQLSKIGALLTVGKKAWSYADSIAKRMYKIDKVEWLDGEQVQSVIVALIKQGKREGWALR